MSAPEETNQSGVPANIGQTASEPKSSLLSTVLPFLWPVVCLILLVSLGVVYFTKPGSKPEDQVPSPIVEAKLPPVAEEPPPPPDTLQRGDALYREGRFTQALTVYQTLGAKAASPGREILTYREGLCQEGIGRYDLALNAFRNLAGQSTHARAQASGQLGMARLWLREQNVAQAKALLYPLVLRSSQPTLRDHPLQGDLKYMVALGMLQAALHRTRPDPLSDAVLGPSGMDYQLERMLDWADLPSKVESIPPESFAVKPVGAKPEDALVSGFVPEVTVLELVNKLASAAQWKVQWSERAKALAEGRQVFLAVEQMPVADVLHAVAAPREVIWKVENGLLLLEEEKEASKEWRASYLTQVCKRSLREAVLAYPKHPLTPAAYLEVGNLEVATGRLAEAAAWYQRLQRDWPNAPVVPQAAFNLGLIQLRLGDYQAAREAFYRVIDSAPSHELAPVAYLRIGRMDLEQARYDQAILPLRRAVSGGVGTPTQAPAALHLGAAYLLAGQPRAANAILVQYRAVVNQDRYRTTATLIDCLARFRLATVRGTGVNEAPDLLSACLNGADPKLLGPLAALLVGQGYQALGLLDQMAKVYETALPDLRGPLAEEMAFGLAQHREANKRRAEAVRIYDSLAVLRDSKWSAPAQFQLARLALEEDRPQECLSRCRRLLREPGTVERSAVLQIMGECFRKLGDLTLAAKCFAGQEPE